MACCRVKPSVRKQIESAENAYVFILNDDLQQRFYRNTFAIVTSMIASVVITMIVIRSIPRSYDYLYDKRYDMLIGFLIGACLIGIFWNGYWTYSVANSIKQVILIPISCGTFILLLIVLEVFSPFGDFPYKVVVFLLMMYIVMTLFCTQNKIIFNSYYGIVFALLVFGVISLLFAAFHIYNVYASHSISEWVFNVPETLWVTVFSTLSFVSAMLEIETQIGQQRRHGDIVAGWKVFVATWTLMAFVYWIFTLLMARLHGIFGCCFSRRG